MYFWKSVLSVTNFPLHQFSLISPFGLIKNRVSRIDKYYAEHATARPPENRSGLRNKDEVEERRQRVINHIEPFTCKASHYGRIGAPGCKYLPSEYTVKKMHALSHEQNHAHISYSLYYSVFVWHILYEWHKIGNYFIYINNNNKFIYIAKYPVNTTCLYNICTYVIIPIPLKLILYTR